MEETNYAVGSQIEQPTETEVVEQPIQAQSTEPTQEPSTQVTQPAEPQKISIEGIGEFSIDELKEMRQGYMRQSDYTRKTQELARQRKEIEEMRMQSTQYTPSNQNVYNPQNQVDPTLQRVQLLEQQLADQQLDYTIRELKGKYSDFDEVAVLNTAYEKGITDLELVYKSLRGETQASVDSLREQIRKEIMQEIETNKTSTQTIISTGDTLPIKQDINLTPQELAIAEAMGIPPDEYAKWR